MNFYNYYLQLCNNVNMKPSPAGEAAGFTRTAVNGWKKGHMPTDSNLQKLAEFFNVPVSTFHECEDIRARDIKQGIKNKIAVITEAEVGKEQPERKKTTATNGDGKIIVDIDTLAQDKEELKRLVDRLTPEEVRYYLSDFRKTILG